MNKKTINEINQKKAATYFYKQIFLFLKQSNGEWRITINPEYLLYWRKTQGVIQEEAEIMKRLDTATWGRIKYLLSRMDDKDKKDLLKREWQKHPVSCIYDEGIPEALEKEFLSNLKNPKIIELK